MFWFLRFVHFFAWIIQIEEAGKFKPLEVDLKRLEDMSDAIVQDFAATRKREEEMRSTNGKWFI